MRYKLFILTSLLLIMLALPVFAAESNQCNLDVSLINQDPDPIIPGNYVELVFQVSGIDNSLCDGAVLELVPSYTFSLDPQENAIRTLAGSTYVSPDYNTFWNVPLIFFLQPFW